MAKGIATFLEKKNDGVHLINRLKETSKDANPLQKLWNWAKHTSLKSSDELVTAKDKRLRTICQIGNIAFSLLSLGVLYQFTPDRKQTKNRRRTCEIKRKILRNFKRFFLLLAGNDRSRERLIAREFTKP